MFFLTLTIRSLCHILSLLFVGGPRGSPFHSQRPGSAGNTPGGLSQRLASAAGNTPGGLRYFTNTINDWLF